MTRFGLKQPPGFTTFGHDTYFKQMLTSTKTSLQWAKRQDVTYVRARLPSASSIASPEPQILTIHDDSNEPTIPYGFGGQLPIVPPNLNDLNLPPNPFNILATMAVVNHTEEANNDTYSPQSPEPSDPSPISTPPKNVSTFNSWETPHTTTDDNTFYSEDKPRRVYWTSPGWNLLFGRANPDEYTYCPVHHRRHLLARWRGS